MLKRKLTKISDALKNLFKSGKNVKKYLLCKECNDVEVEVGADIHAVTCAYCVQRSVEPPASIVKEQQALSGDKFPRGWALKTKYVHTDGRVFSKGKEVGEVVEPIAAPKKKVKKTVAKPKQKKAPKKRK